MGEIDEDLPTLSAETFAALQEFYQEESERDRIKQLVAESGGQGALSMENFEEDWQLSQFWYDQQTTQRLSQICQNLLRSDGKTKIACISCPTLYASLKNALSSEQAELKLFEHDRRFAAFGSDFSFYDYKVPLDIPGGLKDEFDIVIADPPFLSDECLTKTCITVKYLAKDKIIVCTGAVMADMVEKLMNLKPCDFIPKHRNNLANDFRCYTNFSIVFQS